ncbi:DUF4118 domain-containing protein [Pseudomonas cichorii]|uniref:DUF4118 domain-containing protein n=1 Tax=Pseudomonas cichorii TaxID=36746 RepID=UPI001C8A078A|nr:DUF4118 domain-containing protein [Pseudomonas cichorii]MBX8484571.1 DUF4118 domain-containing protein [Pseudomonas cichorii]
MIRLDLPQPLKWAVTLLIVWVAYLLRAKVFTAVPPLPILFFLPAILFSAIFFGRRFGFFATALSSVIAAYFFLPPIGNLGIAAPNAAFSLALFILTSVLITVMGSALRNAYLRSEQLQRQTAIAHEDAEKARALAEKGERERQLLLVEFGHRVKNDMQRTIATLHLQAVHSAPDVASALRQAAGQINVVASMHDRLAHHDGEMSVDMNEYLQDLVAGVNYSMAETRPVEMSVEAQPLRLPLDRAGSVGLITNELITNALKHAFPDGRAGKITVDFCRTDQQFVLTVSDDGIGLPDETSDPASQRKGLGRKLTRALAAQLGGELVVGTGNQAGVTTVLSFPVVES